MSSSKHSHLLKGLRSGVRACGTCHIPNMDYEGCCMKDVCPKRPRNLVSGHDVTQKLQVAKPLPNLIFRYPYLRVVKRNLTRSFYRLEHDLESAMDCWHRVGEPPYLHMEVVTYSQMKGEMERLMVVIEKGLYGV